MSDKETSPKLIIIGSSAGGIEALSTLVSTLPALFPAPVVIAQHLDPSRPSHLNESCRRLFGEDTADGDGRAVRMADERSQSLLPSQTPQVRAAQGQSFVMDFTLSSPSGGARHWLEAIGQPVRGDHEENWAVVVVRDITERSLRIMQEQFTSLATHELRTPLTTIKGYLSMLGKSLKEHGSERQLKYVQIALVQVDQQMRLIEDLLDVTRLQSGKFRLKREPVLLDTLLTRVVETAQILTKGQKIELMIDSKLTNDGLALAGESEDSGERDVGEPLVVDGDATRLEQAVLNLLTNAITYAPDSARIDVRLIRLDGVDVDGVATGIAEIDVQDYGKGIAAGDLSGVFARFYQVSQGGHLHALGLGLGLFITRQIVEAHGGTISVELTAAKALPLL